METAATILLWLLVAIVGLYVAAYIVGTLVAIIVGLVLRRKARKHAAAFRAIQDRRRGPGRF